MSISLYKHGAVAYVLLLSNRLSRGIRTHDFLN